MEGKGLSDVGKGGQEWFRGQLEKRGKIPFTFYIMQSMFVSGSTAGESWGVVGPVEWFFPEVDAAYLSPAHL